MYRVIVNDEVVRRDLPKLSIERKDKILAAIKARLTTNPESFGKPLRRTLKNHRKLRVGDYRVIFRIDGNTVKILAIGHRSVIYKQAIKRK